MLLDYLFKIRDSALSFLSLAVDFIRDFFGVLK